MKYEALRSIVASRKQPLGLQSPSDSFFVCPERVSPYIEPNFSKIEFPREKPSNLLLSAIGASGKTTAAQALSFDIKLPILDLARHKAVGDNTLTGVLTTAYPISSVGEVLKGLQEGTHGIIIDGIDEGRSKATEQGFEAFLDDLIKLSKGSTSTAIIIFGRSQVLLNTWCYFADHDVDVAMVQIDPFNSSQAKEYIDSQVIEKADGYQRNYEKARDGILAELGGVFLTAKDGNQKDAFLSFIGYPPVLDAIVTLLLKERNYHRIQQNLNRGSEDQLKAGLLINISNYLLKREYREKALPNFIRTLADNVGGSRGERLKQSLYRDEEQCARVLSQALGRPFIKQIIDDNALNEQYEKSASQWSEEHPFLDDGCMRNAVFAAFAVARCSLSSVPEYQDLAYIYIEKYKPTYHLLYFLSELTKNREIDTRLFNMLIQSCSEFLSFDADISIDIDGNSWEDDCNEQHMDADLTIKIEFIKKQERTFTFKGRTANTEMVSLGPCLINTKVTLPCDVSLSGASAIEIIGCCSIVARNVHIESPDLILRDIVRRKQDDLQKSKELFINTLKVSGRVNTISFGEENIEILGVKHEVMFPLVNHFKRIPMLEGDLNYQEKYRRLRRIFSEFASHGRGSLAKYRDKIEHERVLKNNLGKQILTALCKKGILRRDSNFYYIMSDQFDSELGISWQQLRQYKSSDKLKEFLQSLL